MQDGYELTAEAAERIRQAAADAEYAIVAASNGLDMAEGLNIFQPSRHLYEAYGDFVQGYGLQAILQGLGARWPSAEEQWAFWARVATTEWLDYEPTPTMRRALSLVTGKPHFAVTCNFDGRLVKAGIEEDRILETEGSIRELVCPQGCSQERYPAGDAFRKLSEATRDCKVPAELIPRCPRCGAALAPAIDEARVYRPDPAYQAARGRFERFLAEAHGKKLLVLELGIGARNRAIKQPLMQLVAREPNATYVTFNYKEVSIPREIAGRSIGVSGDLGAALAAIVPEA